MSRILSLRLIHAMHALTSFNTTVKGANSLTIFLFSKYSQYSKNNEHVMVCHLGTVNNESKMSGQVFICVSMEVNALMNGWINERMNGK